MSNDISVEVLKYLTFKNGFYIECGANDGVFQSNTLRLEKDLGWKGLLIEPSLVGFNNCKLQRSSENIFVNCALVSNEYPQETICGDFDGHPTGSVQGRKRGRVPNVEIKARTITSILDENKVDKVDFFSLDVEGYELEVLKGLDFEKYPITYILIEYNVGEDYLFDFLKTEGYENLGCLSNFNKVEDPFWPGTHNDYLFKRGSI